MATYYMDSNGNFTKKKQNKGKTYVMSSDGSFTKRNDEEDEEQKKRNQERLEALFERGRQQKEAQAESKKTEGGLEFFKASGAWDDGYQFGDVTKATLGTVGDTGLQIGKGAAGLGEGITDAILYGAAGLFDLKESKGIVFDEDDPLYQKPMSEKIRDLAKQDSVENTVKPAEEYLDNYSVLGRTSKSVAQGVGQVGAILATGGMAGAAGLGTAGATALTTAVTGVSGFGSGTGEAYKGGATDKEAYAYGAIAGAADALTELLFGGLGKSVKAVGLSSGVSSLDDIVAKKVSGVFKNQIAKNFTEFGIKAGAEGVEEVLAGLTQAVGKKITYMSEEELGKIIEDENLLEQFVVGAVTSGIAQSGIVPGMKNGSLIEANKTGRDFITGNTQNEQAVIDAEINKRIAEAEKNGEKVKKNKIIEQVKEDMEKGYISTDTIEEVLGGVSYNQFKQGVDGFVGSETYKAYNDAIAEEKSLREEFEELQKVKVSDADLGQQSRFNEVKSRLEEIKKEAKSATLRKELQTEIDRINGLKKKLTQEVSEKVKNERLSESYRELQRSTEKFQADPMKYDNEYARKTVQNIVDSGIANNTNETREFVDFMAKISADKGVVFSLTDAERLAGTRYAKDGATTNAYVTDGGEIVINNDSKKRLNSLVGHEVTHVLEGTELYGKLQEAVFAYAQKKGDYDSRLKAITELYQKHDPKADPKKELTADLVGDYIFTDRDFVYSLSTEHRNVFQKIYDEIKYLVKMATAGSKEARALEKAKKMFEKAYRENVKGKQQVGTNFSLESVDGTEYVKAEKSIFEKEDGTLATEKEVFDSLVGQTIHLPDGDVKIVKSLPKKNMYKELYKRQPKYKQNVDDVKKLNSDVNYNMEELLTNSKAIDVNKPDVDNRHKDQGIVAFDTRKVKFYDGSKAFNIEFSIGVLENGEKVAYAKKFYGYDAELTKKIQAAETSGSTNTTMDQKSVSGNIIPQNSEKSIGEVKKTLTPEQEEYFKDSVVRDESGNLKVMYHGTSKGGHTVFDPYGKANYGLFGAGSYFTDSKAIAESYTKKGKGDTPQVYESYLNIQNPIDMDAQADADAWRNALPEADFPESGTNEQFYRAMEEYFEDNEYARWEAAETAMGVIEEMGYDGITHIGGGRVDADGERHRVYIAFQPEQIKNIDNAKPTSDPDVRFSLGEDTKADNKGRELSTGQAEYFRNSKIRDNSGNLLTMYHGSRESFTAFDRKKAKSNGTYGSGFYFSNSESHAGTYGETYEVYLNIKNPLQDGDRNITKDQLRNFVQELADNEDYGLDNYGYGATVDSVTNSVYGKSDFAMLLDLNISAVGNMVEAVELFNQVNSTDYDGIVAPTETVAFYSEQIKAVSNINPTSAPDIRNSLSTSGDVSRTGGGYAVYGDNIRVRDKSEFDFAPLPTEVAPVQTQETMPKTTTEAEMFPDDCLPGAEADIDSLTDADVPPIPENATPEEGDAVAPSDPFESRDIKAVGDRKVNAYMYENPEVKPFFQEEANIMLGELQRTTKGERFYNMDVYYETNGEAGITGTSRNTSDDIAYLLDELKYSYKQIESGLRAIIEDNGKENNAVSKRIEFLLNDRLMNGYQDFEYGIDIPPNQDYVNLLNEKQIIEYNEEARQKFFEVADDYAPVIEPEELPMRDTNPTLTEMFEDTPIKGRGYEAVTSKKPKENKLVRRDIGTPEEQQIARILDEEPTPENRKSRAWAKFKANFLDKGAVFEDLALESKNRELIGKWNYMLYSEARAQSLMSEGTDYVKSLHSIQEEVGATGKTQQFYEYLYHKHNADRMNLADRYEDKENLPVFGYSVTSEVSDAAARQLEAANPEFAAYAQDIYDYNNHLRQLLVDNGVISQETADLWAEMYPHYVPIRRAGDKGIDINVPLDTGRTSVNAPVKRATGGNSDILPLFETMAQRTLQTYKAIAKNSFGVELKNTLGTTIETGDIDVDDVIDTIDSQDSLLQEGKNGRNPTFTVFEEGEKVTYEITEDMYDALKPMSEGLAYTNKALNTASNFHRGLLTEYNPVFMLTNAIKDVQDILINSQHPGRTYAKVPEAFVQLVSKGYWYKEYMENGGEQNTYFDNETGTFKTENKGLKKILDLPPLSTISALNNFIEMTPRLAEYIASREAGRSVEVSMLDAARVTTNFRAGGDVTKFLNRNGATFLNASVQGAMQQVRNIREAKANGIKGWVALATKFALAGLPAAILNNLMWGDDDEYEELSDYVKQNYYVIGKYGDGKFVRIPKGRTVAVIQDAINRVIDIATGDDEADLNTFLEMAAFGLSNLAPNNPIENNIAAPIIQIANNETWYGEDLVPTRLQDLPPAEQFDESTDALSKWLGQKANISPVKINYLLDQYTGGLGDTVLPMLTPEAESGDNSLVGNLLAPLKSKFTTDGVMNNQNVFDFYDKKDELTTNAKASGATDKDILKNKYMNSINAELADLYAQKREIQNSTYHSDEEKYEMVRTIQNKIVGLTRESLDAYENVNIDGEYATVGDKYFKLNDEGEWQKLSDDQVTKHLITSEAEGESYATNGDVHYRWYQKEGESEGEWRKITDKEYEKQEEVTSGLGISPEEYWSNKEEHDYAYEYPENYAVSKAVGGYEAFRTYSSELYDIKADKDAYGKSISGSRKEKVLNYINGLDITYGEKLVLFKSEYNADDTYNYEIIDYLNSRNDLSYAEIETILKKIGFTVDADGNIYW